MYLYRINHWVYHWVYHWWFLRYTSPHVSISLCLPMPLFFPAVCLLQLGKSVPKSIDFAQRTHAFEFQSHEI